MSINISKSDVIWSYFSLFLFNGINLLLLPFILAFLSSAEIGLWYTFTAVSSLVVILDFGFMTTLSRNVTFVWEGADDISVSGFKENNGDKQVPNYQLFVKLFKTTKFLYLILGVFILVVLMTVGTLYVYNVSKNDLSTQSILISWSFYAIAVFLNMRYAYWSSILKGIGAIKQHQQILVITKLTQLLITIIGIMFGYGLVAVSFAYLISVIINRVLAHYKFYNFQNNNENIRPLMSKKIKNKELINILKRIFPNAYKQGLISISNYINLRSTTLISSAFFGLHITASLGLVLQITNLVTTVANTFFNTYLPQFSSYRFKKEYQKLKKTFKKAIIVNYFIIFISFLCVVLFGNTILGWFNSEVQLLPLRFTVTVMLYVFLYNNQSVYSTFIATKNILPHYKAFFISSIIVLVIQLSLLNVLGPSLWYLLLPILFVQMAYNNWKWPYYVSLEFKELRVQDS